MLTRLSQKSSYVHARKGKVSLSGFREKQIRVFCSCVWEIFPGFALSGIFLACFDISSTTKGASINYVIKKLTILNPAPQPTVIKNLYRVFPRKKTVIRDF